MRVEETPLAITGITGAVAAAAAAVAVAACETREAGRAVAVCTLGCSGRCSCPPLACPCPG